jgi:5-formyltetrahydrofolate cyclo-ligase
MSFQEEKKGLRIEIKKLLQIFSKEELATFSEIALEHLEKDPVFQKADTIMMYWSLNDEVNTHAFIEKWSKKKTILLPKIVDDKIEAHQYKGTDALEIGLFNILHPFTDKYDDKIDLVVVPGRAFDLKGHRLGRGKGHYDNFLKDLSSYKIGLCFAFQVLDYVPSEDFDITMNKIISN